MSTSDGWPAKRMSGDYLAFAFPYGARALQAERAKVQKVLGLSAGWQYGPIGPTFKVPLSFHEGFVRNDTERITLMDRVRTYHNFNWKRDVTGKPHINQSSEGSTPSERHYTKLIDNLIEMQALTETLALISSCASAHELQQAMLNARA